MKILLSLICITTCIRHDSLIAAQSKPNSDDGHLLPGSNETYHPLQPLISEIYDSSASIDEIYNDAPPDADETKIASPPNSEAIHISPPSKSDETYNSQPAPSDEIYKPTTSRSDNIYNAPPPRSNELYTLPLKSGETNIDAPVGLEDIYKSIPPEPEETNNPKPPKSDEIIHNDLLPKPGETNHSPPKPPPKAEETNNSTSTPPRLEHTPKPQPQALDPNPLPVKSHGKRCLTGYMTDIQSWVDENGELTGAVEAMNTIDLSKVLNVVPALQQRLLSLRQPENYSAKYISMAKCNLNRVPMVFNLTDRFKRYLYDTVEFITFYGNDFYDVTSGSENYDVLINATGAREIETPGFIIANDSRKDTVRWNTGFYGIIFTKLRQLDLRKCNISYLTDHSFKGMLKLEALFLSENKITNINSQAFSGLKKLQHLDLSRNCQSVENCFLNFESEDVFSNLKSLKSTDFSFTKMAQRNDNVFKSFGENFEQISLCYSGLSRLDDYTFNNTNLKYIDVSGNPGILNGNYVLGGTEDTLNIVYAEAISLKTIDIFYKFHSLEILKLTDNEIALITAKTAKTFTNLKALDLEKNRMPTWFTQIFIHMAKLMYLSLKDNNVNLISKDMITDIENITYISLSGNFIVCNCHTRELYELALRNELKNEPKILQSEPFFAKFEYHTAYEDFNEIIKNRKNVSKVCYQNDFCDEDANNLESDGNFLLTDYDEGVYRCLAVEEGRSLSFSSVQTCQQTKRDMDIEEVIGDGWSKLLLMIIVPTVIFPLLLVGFLFRRRFKYFYITMRNSAMLSLINKDETIDSEDTIFNYDVFVSYCNEDRNWVLDYLLPHVEKDCNVSVCLHERDFQVGLSILENIVSCMDRSRSIMLIISKRFLLSQWCQFEMHLAQHRLLETRREDLILVLLEEIPRRLRPTTLQYLMLTKTYIVWPEEDKEQPLFWKRLKKSIIMYRLKQPENVSIA